MRFEVGDRVMMGKGQEHDHGTVLGFEGDIRVYVQWDRSGETYTDDVNELGWESDGLEDGTCSDDGCGVCQRVAHLPGSDCAYR